MEGEYDDDGNVPKRWNTILDTNNRNIDPYFSRRAAREEALFLGETYIFQYLCATLYLQFLGEKGGQNVQKNPNFWRGRIESAPTMPPETSALCD